MNKIMELRNKRNTLGADEDLPEEHRGENGLVEASAVEQYNKMAGEVKALGDEIARLEDQAAFDAQLSQPTTHPVTNKPMSRKAENVAPTATDEYAGAFWNMIRNQGDQFAVRNALSVGEDTDGGYTVPDEFERKLIQALEENTIFRQLATVIRTNSGTRKIPIANDTMEASWIDEGEEIPETNTQFGQTTLSAYKLGTMIKISNEHAADSAFDLASLYRPALSVWRWAMPRSVPSSPATEIRSPLASWRMSAARSFGVADHAADEELVTFDEIFDLYYSPKSPYRRSAQFVCNETLLLQLMKLKDKNDNYI